MKAKQSLLLVAAGFAVLNMNTQVRADAQSPASAAPQNRAILAAPRTLEEFPGLARGSASDSKVRPQATRVTNRAFAASPRVLEEFPELARVARSRTSSGSLAPLLQNRAVLVAPRTLEEFPAASRAGLRATGSGANHSTPGLADASK